VSHADLALEHGNQLPVPGQAALLDDPGEFRQGSAGALLDIAQLCGEGLLDICHVSSLQIMGFPIHPELHRLQVVG
jgi:hypothetical protein